MQRHRAALTTTRLNGALGPAGERLAVAHLIGDDRFEMVCCNWRRRHGEVRGELDVVALDHGARRLVVVEVKARRSERHGGPLVAVTPAKQARIRALTAVLLQDVTTPYRRVRFDVVGLLLPSDAPGRLEHVPGAF